MNRTTVLLVLLLFAFPTFVYGVSTFLIKETEKISLAPEVTDPDNDVLSIFYSSPLDKNGFWQTTYGDEGEYEVIITVTDGETEVSKEALIIVERKEETPQIKSFSPADQVITIKETDKVNFMVKAVDLNSDELGYKWFLDNRQVSTDKQFNYKTDYNSHGTHDILVHISDGKSSVNTQWTIEVANVDIESIIESIKDVKIEETQIARLKLPNFKMYGLTYTISQPMGNDNEWQTEYGDDGSYAVKINVKGPGIDYEKITELVVKNKDRPPVFEKLSNQVVKENETIKFEVRVTDLDDDKITLEAKNLPKGAQFKKNTFTWTPDFDAVVRENLIDKIIDYFTVLKKTYYVQFVAESGGVEIVRNLAITVENVNRPPLLNGLKVVSINEGELLEIKPDIKDYDGDKVKVKYSGFVDKNIYRSTLDDSGVYDVTITASDGKEKVSKDIIVNISNVNQAPVFGDIGEIHAQEGDTVAILLDAYDPDGDPLNFSIDNPPELSALTGNSFVFTSGFDLVRHGNTRNYDLIFAASDGIDQARKVIKLFIADKNRPPKIVNASSFVGTRLGEPVNMYVEATDEDGDDLTYTWEFSFLEKYTGPTTHDRVFTTKGVKKVKVFVSDGVDEIEHIINVNVV